jgi:hypothetical protein
MAAETIHSRPRGSIVRTSAQKDTTTIGAAVEADLLVEIGRGSSRRQQLLPTIMPYIQKILRPFVNKKHGSNHGHHL